MDEYTTRFTACASLAIVGVRMRRMEIWEVVERHVHIKQKVIKYQPEDKLLDEFINILSGGHGTVEINTRVRPDSQLQRAFGRETCAEQSTVSETLNACTEDNVKEMRQANREIYRTYGQSHQHDYERGWQVLDVDMTGMPAGRKGEGVTKGFFSGERNRRGRQLGRVVATMYGEIVEERLYSGKIQLERSLQELVTVAKEAMGLTEVRRRRTIVRVDGGGGRDADINWLLNRGYSLMIKVKNWQRSVKLARSVTTWYPDPKEPGREAGWVEEPHQYDSPTRQVAIRRRKKDGKWGYRVLVFNLPNDTLFWLARQPLRKEPTVTQLLFAALCAYDLRGGGVETTFRGSKEGLGLTKRNKRRFAAQEMLALLAQLAYNLITWTRNLLARHSHFLRKYGILRMVRDVFHISGKVKLNAKGQILEITLNKQHDLALPFVQCFSSCMARDGPSLNLGQI